MYQIQLPITPTKITHNSVSGNTQTVTVQSTGYDTRVVRYDTVARTLNADGSVSVNISSTTLYNNINDHTTTASYTAKASAPNPDGSIPCTVTANRNG